MLNQEYGPLLGLTLTRTARIKLSTSKGCHQANGCQTARGVWLGSEIAPFREGESFCSLKMSQCMLPWGLKFQFQLLRWPNVRQVGNQSIGFWLLLSQTSNHLGVGGDTDICDASSAQNYVPCVPLWACSLMLEIPPCAPDIDVFPPYNILDTYIDISLSSSSRRVVDMVVLHVHSQWIAVSTTPSQAPA